MNWGHKITLAILAFFAIILFMVVRSFQENIDLVTENYYGEEIVYQDKIDKISNVRIYDREVKAYLVPEGIQLLFPDEMIPENVKGTLHLYRPSMAERDKTYEIQTDSTFKYLVPAGDVVEGKYILKLDWTDGEHVYFQEIMVFVPKS
ncbi:MAG: FixH family protein [Cyclobacteriaceae bacterium]|nr:FixH family protein [Cyclobacteriaceae bacterium]